MLHQERERVMGDPGLAAAGLMMPMITPKCDTSNLSRTVTRLAKKDEVCFSLTGSPVAPYTTNKSKVGALTIYKLGLSCCPVACKHQTSYERAMISPMELMIKLCYGCVQT